MSSDSIDDDYIEAILLWSAGGPDPEVENWLADRSLQAIPMRSGLLISGDRLAFEQAFQVELRRAQRPMKLPIPVEFGQSVSSIVIPELPEFGAPTGR